MIYEKIGVEQAQWNEVIVDIPAAYNNETVYLAFRNHAAGDALLLDDISISGKNM